MWMYLDEQWVNLAQICRVKFTTPQGQLQAFLFMSDARSITVKNSEELAALQDYLEADPAEAPR
ncbi:hypothetical protein B1R32_11668 [Abditibacterium utsteinense]|uniref:Uncharacterized protein n=1 Tax=Abditibacterium utsteinense TaxID=1960156 RepID=A0A2S8SQK9_9BACT|nr:hypothetical protein [Abditibacterium utsteinense]PQV63091.1 hypothetical protein B1R32_11668 [Abditibacterium utsteinense]